MEVELVSRGSAAGSTADVSIIGSCSDFAMSNSGESGTVERLNGTAFGAVVVFGIVAGVAELAGTGVADIKLLTLSAKDCTSNKELGELFHSKMPAKHFAT